MDRSAKEWKLCNRASRVLIRGAGQEERDAQGRGMAWHGVSVGSTDTARKINTSIAAEKRN